MATSKQKSKSERSAKVSRNKRVMQSSSPAREKTPKPKLKTGARIASAESNTSPASKQDTVLSMLYRAKGATIASIVAATGWQPHSVRGFLAGVVKKKLKLKLDSKKLSGERVYWISKSGPAS